jgi:Cdc6-like AAA superfamily ATPase
MRLSGREQVSHKTLSELVSELELYGYVEVERKGRGRGKGVAFTSLLRNRLSGKRYWTRTKIWYKEKRHGD